MPPRASSSGALSTLNKLAAEHTAVAIIHSGDFGFYEPSSLPSISDRTLRHLVQYSSLISPAFRSALLAPNVQPAQLREMLASPPLKLPGGAPGPTVDDPSYFGLSDFPKLLAGEIKLRVPVYTVWGACEDVAVLEKIRLAAPSFLNVPASAEELQAATGAGEGPAGRSNLATTYGYSIPNLTVLDEATTRVLLIGGVRLRLFGLGGAVVSHRLFDNGTGNATIAGGGGTMWTTVLQVGELVDTAQKVYDATETRLLVSHASPGREGLLAQLALVLKADLTVSAGLHFRYGVSYNEFSVQHDPEAYKLKLEYAKKGFNDIWDTVKSQVESVVDPNQRVLLKNALAVANRVPSSGAPSGPAGAAGTTNATEETAWKNCWNWNLPDAAYGSLLLDIVDGRIGSEMRSQGFNFAYRQNKPAPSAPAAAAATASSGAQTSSAQNASTTAPKSAETKVETTSVLAQAPVAPPSATATSANPNVAPPTGPSHGGPGVHRGGRGGYGERGGRGGFGPNGRTASGRGGAAVGRSNGSWSSGGERNGPEGGFRGERKERNETAAASNGSNNTNESKVNASGVAKDGDRAVDKKIEATSAAAEKEDGVSSTPTTPSAPKGGRGGHNGRSERGGRHPRGGQAGHKSGGGGQLSSSSGNGAKEKEANNESLTAAPATPVASGAASGGGDASSSESAVAGAPTTGTSGHGERGGRGGRGAGRGRGGGRGGRGGGNHHQTASGSVERVEGWNSFPVPEGGRVNRKENNNNDEGGKSKGAAGEGEGWSAPSDAQEGGQGGW